MSLSVYKPNPLTYPGYRLPGFDPSHPVMVAGKCLFSGIALGANFIDVISAKPGTPVTLSQTVDSALGPALLTTGQTGGQTCIFSGRNATNFTSCTIAVILRVTINNSGFQYFFSNNQSSAGVAVNIDGSGILQWTMFGVLAASSGITLSANVPYFIAVSMNGSSAIDYVVARLDNGQIFTASSASATPNVGDGNYGVATPPNGGGGSSKTPIGDVAAVFYGSGYSSRQTRVAWAADPWAFWYPRTLTDIMFNSLGIIPAAAAAPIVINFVENEF